MLDINKEGENINKISSDMPILRFTPLNKETVQRLVMRGVLTKNVNEFNAIFQWKDQLGLIHEI